MSIFRLLQLSDLHFCIQPNRRNFTRLFQWPPILTLNNFGNYYLSIFPASYSEDLSEATARFVFEQNGQFDLLVISGDLANTGRTEDLLAALRFIQEPIQFGWLGGTRRPTLGASPTSAFLLPGNHDRYRDQMGSAGCIEFDRIFSSYWDTPDYVQHTILEKGGERVALISADFCLRCNKDAQHPTFINRWGRGKAYKEVLDALESRTNKIRDCYSPIAVIWLTHFPPIENCSTLLRLIRTQYVTKSAKNNSIGLILSGHIHEIIEYSMPHGTKVSCAGSATSLDQEGNNWIHFIDLQVQNGELKKYVKHNYRWHDESGEFILNAAS